MKILLAFFSIIFSLAVIAGEFTVGSYNVENLFNDKHDEGHEDWTYLPKNSPLKKNCKAIKEKRWLDECLKTDWSKKKIDKKLEKIKEVLVKRGKLPTVLVIIEVESKDILTLLGKKLGYSGVEITSGADRRGINVGILYKEENGLKFLAKNEHSVFLGTRNILEVKFQINEKQKLTIFGNHWPSQGKPTKARIDAAVKLNELVPMGSDDFVVALGDFNTIETEYPSPFKSLSQLTDVTDGLSGGTYYYHPKRVWNKLDRIFVSKNLVEKSKGEIYRPDFLVSSLISKSEDSLLPDHLPVFITIKI